MLITRRGLLAGIFAAAAAPTIVRAASLMPIYVPKIVVAPIKYYWDPSELTIASANRAMEKFLFNATYGMRNQPVLNHEQQMALMSKMIERRLSHKKQMLGI